MFIYLQLLVATPFEVSEQTNIQFFWVAKPLRPPLLSLLVRTFQILSDVSFA